MYASFGSQVTVLESYPELIVREDRDIAASVKRNIREKGIVFRMNAKVQSVKHIEDGAVVVFLIHKLVRWWNLLMLYCWLGRRPNTKDLNLEVAGWRRMHAERSL